jgi:hypothetical protein
MEVNVGSSALSVTSLGRWCVSGNIGSHVVKLVEVSTGLDVPGGSVVVLMNPAQAGSYQYTELPSPVTLAANTAYYLASAEQISGDTFYNSGPVVSTAVAGVTGSVYQSGADPWVFVSPGAAYVPVNFTYR